MRVLVIEDDRKVASFVQAGLQQEGHAVDVLHEGTAAGDQAVAVDYDAVVLDLMLPGRSGFQVLRDIRARKAALPILILTARDSVQDRIAGLDSGADDYMAKPFALAELSARLRALQRRGAPRENVLRLADLEMDILRRSVKRAGTSVDLTPKEYALLEFLMRNSERPLTRSLIIEHVWDIHFDSISNVVEVHINSLRNKIDRGFDRPLIHTIRGVGYVTDRSHLVTLTLRARLAVIWSVVFGLLMFVVSDVSYGLLKRSLDDDVTVRLAELTEGLHGYLREDGDTLVVEFDAADNDQATFVHEATRYYQVYDGASQLRQSVGFPPLGLQNSAAQVAAYRREPMNFDITTDYGRLRVSNSLVNGVHGPYLLQVGVSMAPLDAALARYRDLLVWGVPAALAIAVAAAWWLSGFALRPLARVAQAARAIDVSSLERRVPVRNVSDELEDVARAFNGILERLERSVTEMRQFSAALAHELRTPLTALRGEMEMTLRRMPQDEAFRQSVVSQIEEIDTLKRLIDNTLTLARAESGQIPLTFGPVDLTALAGSLAEQLTLVAEAESLVLACSGADGVIVDGDREWLARMLINLIDNALKFTRPGGRVEIRVEHASSGGRIEVRDTGIGMASDVAERAFEHFYRGDPARSSTVAGSGLGLTLVKWIVDRHRGTIAVVSEPGRGSSFIVTLPGASGASRAPVESAP